MRSSLLIFAMAGEMLTQAVRGEVPSSVKVARDFFQTGRLDDVSELSRPESRQRILAQPIEGYLAGEALLAGNRRIEALRLAEELETALPRSAVGPFLRFREADLGGRTSEARKLAHEYTNRSDISGYWWGRSAIDWVLIGRMRLAAGGDAKAVLEGCFERALKDDPNCEEAFASVVELALGCGDFELAANKAKEGLKRFPKNALLLALWGNSLQWSAPKEAAEKWTQALELNPSQTAALASMAVMAFITEDDTSLQDRMNRLPQWHVEASAISLARAYSGSNKRQLANLETTFATNPLVLHRAGVLLSSRYRFSEAAELQKKALLNDPELFQAKRALAENLLRLGRPSEAWALLEEVHSKDGYDITVFNLLELRDRVASFTKVESEHFDVWMAPTEAPVYGDRVLKLLEEAYAKLSGKYRFKPAHRTTVEIFPEQKDFAVRTFGVPGGDGYLGVCFGPVITAPSPASPRASGHSWEATLWHEFTHTLTLSLTRNQMPRWLSEGISVHEEQQANAGWGQRFRPRHAGRLLAGRFSSVDRMSEAFRTGDGEELDFAYFQAGLIVDWMVKKAGHETLRTMLEDLGRGTEINVAISKRYGPMDKVNTEFQKYATAWAKDIGGALKWKSQTEAGLRGGQDRRSGDSEKSYEDLVKEGERAFSIKDFETARNRFEEVLARAPKAVDTEGPLYWLAKTYRALGLEQMEVEILQRSLNARADFPEAHARLIELFTKNRDWQRVAEVSEQYLGVSPMSLRLLDGLATANEQQGHKILAVNLLKKCLILDSERKSRWQSRIGVLLEEVDPKSARNYLLEALEVNPRDRVALESLARITTHPRKMTPEERGDGISGPSNDGQALGGKFK